MNWLTTLPQRMQEPSFRAQQGSQLVDTYDAVPPIYFVRSRAKLRRVSGALRLSFAQRDLFLQYEPSYRGRRFNADFEGLGSTRETVIEDWSLSALNGGAGFMLSLTLAIFDVGQLLIQFDPDQATVSIIGNAPTVVQP